MPLRPLLAALCLATAVPAAAEAPRVAVDIRPVHSLVAALMEGAGTPDLLGSGGGSPHGGALRPSEARALQDADLVVWIGPGLTPWLTGPIATLAEDAQRIALLDLAETHALPARTDAAFAHAGDGEAHGHDDQGHGDHGHDEQGHDDHHGHDGHRHEAGGPDPHAWLDPRNARAWVAPIAAALADLDPANAATYEANAAALSERLTRLDADLRARLSPVSDRPFAVVHDAFQYLEARYGLTVVGALSLSDAADPGPARMSALQDELGTDGIRCLVAEPHTDSGIVRTLVEGSTVSTVTLDPLGQTLAAGPDHYPAAMRAIAKRLADCLT